MKKTISLTEKDRKLLQDALKRSTMPEHNRLKLEDELNSAQLFTDDKLPADVICLNSTIELKDTEKNNTMEITLVLPGEANMKHQKVSVFAPIGIALIGYKTGDMVEWEMPAGIKQFEILKVINL
ncbi:GreA/GreB family elongation factor [Solitalea lacus]|uniref:GreA/GreB family elongation factor n=1 Tax=Solitalea lacus TaxID=2911172 RepID=UPI001EDAC773|nr:GreA/GreB family elongation factor [Solitalea lacus]UKJ08771.1 GreA/GreB family elongation factor [Solitalea lacus]